MRRAALLAVALAVAFAVALACPPPSRAAAAVPLGAVSTFEDYRARVDAAHDYAERTLPNSWRDPLAAREAAAEINTFLPGTERVRVGTRTIDVDNSILRSLVARLDSSDDAGSRRETVVDIRAHLGSLKLAVDDAARSGARPDPALLAELLARPDLSSRPTLADQVARQLERLSRWVQDWLSRVFRRRGAVAASDLAVGVVFLVLATLLAMALVQVVRSISAALARHDERVMSERAADAAVVAAAEGLPADALGYAEELAAAGRFREAVRALFGGAARTLVDLGLLRSTRTRTNAELLADLAPAAPPVLQPLSELSGAFERAWYGHADPGAAGFEAARERYRDSVRSAERARERRAAEEAGS